MKIKTFKKHLTGFIGINRQGRMPLRHRGTLSLSVTFSIHPHLFFSTDTCEAGKGTTPWVWRCRRTVSLARTVQHPIDFGLPWWLCSQMFSPHDHFEPIPLSLQKDLFSTPLPPKSFSTRARVTLIKDISSSLPLVEHWIFFQSNFHEWPRTINRLCQITNARHHVPWRQSRLCPLSNHILSKKINHDHTNSTLFGKKRSKQRRGSRKLIIIRVPHQPHEHSHYAP